MKRVLIAFLFGLTTTQIAGAQEVQLKKALDDMEARLVPKAAEMKAACGVDIAFTLDRPSWTRPELLTNKPAPWCMSVADGIVGLCADPAYKAAIAKSVTRVSCSYDEALLGGATNNYGNRHDMRGTELRVWFNEGSSNLKPKVQEYLKSTL